MFSSKTSNFERLLDKATSKLLLEPEWEAVMQICDILRQGDVQPSLALVSLRKKLDSDNYHICNYGLLVLESVVKNCGSTMHNAVATKEFMAYMHQLAKKKQDSLKSKVLELIQVWSHAFRTDPSYRVIQDTYTAMKTEGFQFPTLKESDAMFASEKAPDWMDGEHCHQCVSAFTTFNRKHHCRACGQVFCQKCSSKTCIIPRFGIEKEVRVCDACHDQLNKAQEAEKQEDQLPDEYVNSSLSKQPQVAAVRTEAEVREEEELQLALALSQSEAEAKKNKPKTFNSSQAPPASVKAENIYSQPQKQQKPPQQPQQQQPQQQPSVMDTSDMDPELARYLNRNYWQQKSFELKTNPSTTQPSAPLPTATTTHSSVKKIEALPQPEQQLTTTNDADHEQTQFLAALSSSIEIFMNRMKSNSHRHRSIANDSSVQTLFMTLTAMHPTLLKYLQKLEASRAHYEGLQDKLGQLKDARDALDVLREEHREKERRRQEEVEKQRQVQLAHKLEVLRQQKQVYLEYQRQMALQRMQEQEMEMRKRLEEQKQQHQLKAQQYAHPQAYQSVAGYPSAQPPYQYPPHMSQPPPHAYPPQATYPLNIPPTQQQQLSQQQMQQIPQPPLQQQSQQPVMVLPQQQQQPALYQQHPHQIKQNGYDGYGQTQQQPQQQIQHQLPQQHLPQQQPAQPPLQQQPSQLQQQPVVYAPQQQQQQQTAYPAFNPAFQQQTFSGSEQSEQPTTQQLPAISNEAELINFD